MEPRRKKYLLYVPVIIVGSSLLFILEETIRLKNTGFGIKTLWDWMELLIIPIVLTIGAFILNLSEREIERRRTDERAKLERQYAAERARREGHEADERALFERLRAKDRQQEATLQGYLDRMADLLLKEKLLTSKNKEVRNIARILTLTALRGLDVRRKGLILLFLREANLITRVKPEDPVIDLNGADLSGADLSKMMLTHADLVGANLSGANLSSAILSFSSLAGANLFEANLEQTILGSTNLYSANLRGANLSHAIFDNTDLREANLKDAIMPDGTKHE